MMLKSRQLTDSASRNLSEARKKIARRSRTEKLRNSSAIAESLKMKVPTNIVFNEANDVQIT